MKQKGTWFGPAIVQVGTNAPFDLILRLAIFG